MPETLTVAPWRTYAVEVAALRRLSPSFLRVTFTGPDLDRFADNGYDQRIKIAMPRWPGDTAELPAGSDWYQRWRALPAADRSPVRTYTVRAVRRVSAEVDVDLVLHGDGGPATRWAQQARVGDRLALVGPDAGYPGEHGGIEFRPPAGATLLLAGDETAVPAICAILERLPVDVDATVLMEVPDPADALPLVVPPGVDVTWLARGHDAPGSRLIPTMAALPGLAPVAVPPVGADPAGVPPVGVTPAAGQVGAGRVAAGGSVATTALTDVDVDREILWEVPTAAATPAGWYAWLAGEAGMIRTLRRLLVAERGLDRRAVAFMGYYRLGRGADQD